MVEALKQQSILSDPRIEAALRQVPRHLFLPGTGLPEAYADQAVITHRQNGVPVSSASQPAMVTVMLEQLRPQLGASILEIGAGTGYNAALLAHLVGAGGRVVTIDIDPGVAAEARDHLAAAQITNATVICGDGALGWAGGAPYDGIIVTASAPDLAPAWTGQLAPAGRVVVPLSIRGIQHSVALTRADGHLRSIAIHGCHFIPLTGVMANAGRRQPVPGHPGVHIETAADTEADPDLIRDALGHRGPAAGIGISALSPEVFASLRPWLIFHEPAMASLAYTGPQAGADASRVPAVIDFTLQGITHRSTLCIPGHGGVAILDITRAAPAGNAGPVRLLDLAVRGYGDAEQEKARLTELATTWDAAGRPGTSRLDIHAYPSAAPRPETEGMVHVAPHTTFTVSYS
jgi:protein-L-isoaspartate(D-aspartate) O-methyltransferase